MTPLPSTLRCRGLNYNIRLMLTSESKYALYFRPYKLEVKLSRSVARYFNMKCARRNRIVSRGGDEQNRQVRHEEVWYTTVDSGARAIAILGDRWCPHTAKQEGDRKIKQSSSTLVSK